MSTTAVSSRSRRQGRQLSHRIAHARRSVHARGPERGAAADGRDRRPSLRATRFCPLRTDIDAKKPGVLSGLLRKAAELGFTSVDIPEEYGGLGMDKTTSTIITDHLSVQASFSTAYGAHTGIATLPLVWYGTEEQKKRYLPKLASGEWIGAYGLSEATSGSDAMNVRARATLSADGATYTLNGEKMWITNCGIAGLYTVFAKIDGEKFSAFLIERDTPGLTVGAEEHKLGIRGSSTCPLVLQDCKVPGRQPARGAGKRPPHRLQRA